MNTHGSESVSFSTSTTSRTTVLSIPVPAGTAVLVTMRLVGKQAGALSELGGTVSSHHCYNDAGTLTAASSNIAAFGSFGNTGCLLAGSPVAVPDGGSPNVLIQIDPRTSNATDWRAVVDWVRA